MANNTFQLKRSSVANKQPNTSTLAIGELALNLTDRKLYSSDGTNVFETGANLTTLAVSANIALTNTTSNWIYWGAAGTDAPTFTTRSAGTKLVLYPAISGSYADYAIGINSGTLWYSVPSYDAGQYFKWYGGTTEIASLSGTGNLSLAGSVNAASHTIGTDLVANSLGVYHTGVINAARAQIGSAIVANSSRLVIGTSVGVSANGGLGTSGQVLTSNGTTVYWANTSSGGGGLISQQQYTADGTTSTFTVTGGYTANQLSVYLNGVLLRNGLEANVISGSTFTITPTPANGSLIDAIGISGIYANGLNTVVTQQFTANGTANTFQVTGGYVPNQIQVYLNGVKQVPGTDVIVTSGNTVNFAATPANNFIVDVYGYQTSVTVASNTLTVAGSLTTNTLTVTTNTATIGTSIYSVANGNLGVGTVSPTTKLDVTGQLTVKDSANNMARINLNNGFRNWTISNYGTQFNPNGAFVIADETAVATRLMIDTSGNIGVGGVIPSTTLHVKKDSANGTTYPIYVDNGAGGAGVNIAGIGFVNAGSSIKSSITAGVYGNDFMAFNVNSNTERMRIDAQGRVTKPYQPAFFASGTGGTVNMSTGSYLPFNTLYTAYAGSNRNSGYNTGTYLYTAPVAGLYQFYVQLYISPSSRNNSITWWKNGSQMNFADAAQAVYFSTTSSTTPDTVVLSGAILMELAASDYVGLQVRTTFGTVTMYMGHSSFWGYLVG